MEWGAISRKRTCDLAKQPVSCMIVGIVLILAVFFLKPFDSYGNTENNKKIVRVGYPIQRGLTGKDENGNYSGYTVDYLKELENYVGFRFEFVEVEGDLNTQIMTLMKMLESGEIDMLGAMNYSEDLAEKYLYPSYNYGTAYTALAVHKDSEQWMDDDYQNWNGLRVACYPKMQQRMELLSQFAEVSGFTYEIVMCENYDKMIQAVLSGKADAILQIDISMDTELRGIARFSPSPYYFAVNKDRPDVLRELNAGMYSLLQAYPNLQTQLYNRYFTTEGHFYISEESRSWIEKLEPVRVLFFDGNAPIQSGTEAESVKGVAVSYFDRLSRATGLSYQPVVAKNYEEGLRLIWEGKVDLVAAVPADAILPSRAGLHLSQPYFESGGVLVSQTQKTELEPEKIQKLAANVEGKMKELLKNPEQGAMMDSYCVSYYMQKQKMYEDLTVEWMERDPIFYCVGFTSHADKRLLPIINKFSRSLTDENRQQMLYQNISGGARYTLSERLYVYRWQLLLLIQVFLLIFYLLRLYMKNRLLQKESESVERLRKFSQMIDECLFEYSEKEDRLVVQNNHVFLPDLPVMEKFMFGKENYRFASENERLSVSFLRDMIRNRETQKEMRLTDCGKEKWYRYRVVWLDKGYALGRILDVTENVKRRTELEHQATTDPLTGLMNRAALRKKIEDYLQNEENSGVFLLLDLDNFKKVNDCIGHDEGDRLLKVLAVHLEKSFSPQDWKGRLGGDEFVIFLKGRIESGQLRQMLNTLLESLNREVFAPYQEYAVSASIGASYTSETLRSEEKLYKEADNAMYVAKYAGKNRYFISSGEECTLRTCQQCREVCEKKEYLAEKYQKS